MVLTSLVGQSQLISQARWQRPIILASWEARTEESKVQGQPIQFRETLSQTTAKRGLGVWLNANVLA